MTIEYWQYWGVTVNSPEYVPGEWYVVVICHHCRARHPLFHDLTRGQAKLRATYRWTCPDCKEKGDYDADVLERYQSPLCKAMS
jgi:hypothetical protein